MEIESPEDNGQSIEKKDGLLTNDFADFDIGSFKIKKKKKKVEDDEGDGDSGKMVEDSNKSDLVKYIKIEEMNVIKVNSL